AVARTTPPYAGDRAGVTEVVRLFRRLGLHRSDVRLHGLHGRADLGDHADPAAAPGTARAVRAPAQPAPRDLRQPHDARHRAVAARGARDLARYRILPSVAAAA